MEKLFKTKTFWTGVVGLVTTIGAYVTGSMELATAIQTGITCLLGIFLRHGMKK